MIDQMQGNPVVIPYEGLPVWDIDLEDLGMLVMATIAFTMGARGIAPDTEEQADKYRQLRGCCQRLGLVVGLEVADWTPEDWMSL